jgi:hypothetical protein
MELVWLVELLASTLPQVLQLRECLLLLLQDLLLGDDLGILLRESLRVVQAELSLSVGGNHCPNIEVLLRALKARDGIVPFMLLSMANHTALVEGLLTLEQ